MNEVMIQTTGSVPVIPQASLAAYNHAALAMMESFGASFNVIRPGKVDFTLIEGGNKRQAPNGQVIGVLLGLSTIDHCVWYRKAYAPGQEPEKPDLVWNWPDHSKFPAALPAKFHQKIEKQGAMRWDFKVSRRSVWALISQGADGKTRLNFDDLYIFDISSMSLYGKSMPQVGQYKYSGLVNLCQRLSQGAAQVSPAMFMTNIVIDTVAPVSGVVMFSPVTDKEGRIKFLPEQLFTQVVDVMCSQRVADMLKVQEKLGDESSPMPAAPVVESEIVSASLAKPEPAPQQTASVITITTAAKTGETVEAPKPAPVAPADDDLLAQAQAAMDASDIVSAPGDGPLAEAQAEIENPKAVPKFGPVQPSENISSQTASALMDLDAFLS